METLQNTKKMPNNQEAKTRIKKRITTVLVIAWSFLVFFAGFYAFWVFERYGIKPSLNCMQCAGSDENQFQNIVGFYEMLITFQFGIIGILLVVCFLYTQHVSKKHAEEIVEEEMASARMRERISRYCLPIVKRITKTKGKEFLISLLEAEGIDDMLAKLEDYEGKLRELDTIVRSFASQPSSGRKSSGKKLSAQPRKEVPDGNNS